jgi:hypothetical protein
MLLWKRRFFDVNIFRRNAVPFILTTPLFVDQTLAASRRITRAIPLLSVDTAHAPSVTNDLEHRFAFVLT